MFTERIGPEADYIVVNVSSPNTPGLRRLQEKGHLGDLVAHCLTARDAVREGFGGQRASEAGMESGDKGTAPPLPLFIKVMDGWMSGWVDGWIDNNEVYCPTIFFSDV